MKEGSLNGSKKRGGLTKVSGIRLKSSFTHPSQVRRRSSLRHRRKAFWAYRCRHLRRLSGSSSSDTCIWAPSVGMSSHRCTTRRLESGLLDVRRGCCLIFIGSSLSSRRVGFAMYLADGWVQLSLFFVLEVGHSPLP